MKFFRGTKIGQLVIDLHILHFYTDSIIFCVNILNAI